jgi:hypothetical protein
MPADGVAAESTALEADETFVLFTDGVSEAFGPDGDTRTVIFTLTPEQFARISTGDAIRVRYDGADRGWNFGPVDKNMLK